MIFALRVKRLLFPSVAIINKLNAENFIYVLNNGVCSYVHYVYQKVISAEAVLQTLSF